MLLLFIGGVVLLLIIYFLLVKRRAIKLYQKDLENRGYIKIKINFIDGGFKKGYITQAQFRNFGNVMDLTAKGIKPESGNIKVKRERVYYIEVI